MQRSILASVGVFIVFLCLASPALAGIFTYQFIGDLDGAAPFTDREGGQAILNSETGDLAVGLAGLRPNTVYTCCISCQFDKFADAPCPTNRRGSLLAFLPGLGRSGDLATGCGFPNVTIFADDPADAGDFCQNGYGQP
jgi:hypothetical protein